MYRIIAVVFYRVLHGKSLIVSSFLILRDENFQLVVCELWIIDGVVVVNVDLLKLSMVSSLLAIVRPKAIYTGAHYLLQRE